MTTNNRYGTGRKLAVVAAVLVVFVGAASAIEINSSQALKYYGNGDLDFRVDNQGNVTAYSDLDMQGNRIESFFDGTTCDDYVTKINPDGTYECGTDNTGADDQNLSEVLAVGNVANQSIDMDSNALEFLGALYSDDGSTSFFSGGAGDSETVTGINADGTLQTTSISVGSSNIQSGAVRDIELAANAVNASGSHLDSSIAGSSLTLNNGQLDVSDNWIDEGTTDIGNALVWSGNVIYVDESQISHDNLTDVASDDHHTRPTAGDGLTDDSNTFNINPADFAGTYLSDDGSSNLQVDIAGGLQDDGNGNIEVDWTAANDLTTGGDIAVGAVTNPTIAIDAVNESQIDSAAFGGGIAGGSGSQITVGAGDGLTQETGGLAVASNVALTDQQESINAGQWIFENNLTVQGDLDVWGNITNTDVQNLNVNGSILPPSGYDNQFDIGSSARRWQDGYFGGSITIDNGLTVSAGTVSLPNDAISNSELANSGFTLSAGDNLSITSSDIALGDSVTIDHADTSSQGDVSGSDGTVLQTVNLDGNGHVTGMGTIDLDTRYYTQSTADDTFVDETGDTMTGDLAVRRSDSDLVRMEINNTAGSGDADAMLDTESSAAGENGIRFHHDGTRHWALLGGDAWGDSGSNLVFYDYGADVEALRLKDGTQNIEIPNGNLNMSGGNVDNVNQISGDGGPVQVANDVQMTGSSPEVDLGNGMSVQRTNGDVVISD